MQGNRHGSGERVGKKRAQSASTAHLCGGLAAGFASTSLLYPLELVRTRFQANFTYRGTFPAVWEIFRSGGVKDLYRGYLPGIVGSTLAWGEFFWLYGSIKETLQNNRNERLSPLHHLMASFTSGVIVQLSLCPIWVIKNNQQLGNFNSFGEGVRHLYHKEGIRGFYRGLTPGIFSSIQGGVQFLVYEECRHLAIQSRHHRSDAGNYDRRGGGKRKVARNDNEYLPVPITMACTIASKTVAMFVTNPIEVVKVRMRHVGAGIEYTNVYDSVRAIAKGEGIFGFYKGLRTNLIRLLPAQCTTFTVYEGVKAHMLQKQQSV